MGHWCRRRRRCSPPPPPSPGRTPLEMSVYPGDGWPPSPSPSPPPPSPLPSADSARIDFSPLPCLLLALSGISCCFFPLTHPFHFLSTFFAETSQLVAFRVRDAARRPVGRPVAQLRRRDARAAPARITLGGQHQRSR